MHSGFSSSSSLHSSNNHHHIIRNPHIKYSHMEEHKENVRILDKSEKQQDDEVEDVKKTETLRSSIIRFIRNNSMFRIFIHVLDGILTLSCAFQYQSDDVASFDRFMVFMGAMFIRIATNRQRGTAFLQLILTFTLIIELTQLIAIFAENGRPGLPLATVIIVFFLEGAMLFTSNTDDTLNDQTKILVSIFEFVYAILAGFFPVVMLAIFSVFQFLIVFRIALEVDQDTVSTVKKRYLFVVEDMRLDADFIPATKSIQSAHNADEEVQLKIDMNPHDPDDLASYDQQMDSLSNLEKRKGNGK